MGPPHQSYKRWRSSLASHRLTMPTAASPCKLSARSRPLEDSWDSLASFISAVKSTDLVFEKLLSILYPRCILALSLLRGLAYVARWRPYREYRCLFQVFRTEALHQLSLFLLYLCPSLETSFNCPDAFTISFLFKSKELLVPVKDIEALYKILFSELASYTDWLFRPNAVELQLDCRIISDDFCDGVHLMLLVELLRCCIRILPFLEFNTSLSLVAAEIVASFLKQLCCPTSLRVLVSGGFNDATYSRREQSKVSHNFSGPHFHGSHGNNLLNCNPMSYISVFKSTIEDLQDHLSHGKKGFFPFNQFGNDSMTCCLHSAKKQTDRLQMAVALLEVFMDELLLEPGLADVFLASTPDAVLESSNDNGLSCATYAQMAIEAAAAHFILSISCSNYFEKLHGRLHITHSGYIGLGMSLPAAVALLDLVLVDGMQIPDVFLSHIISSLMMSFSHRSCLVPQLPGTVVLGLVASLLETAVNLYFKMWTNSSLSNNYYEYNSIQERFWALSHGEIATSSVLRLLFDEKIHIESGEPFFDVRYATNITTCQDRGLERPSHGQSIFCNSWRGSSYNSFQRQDHVLHIFDRCSTKTSSTCLVSNSSVLASVLQLISFSLHYMVTEVKKGDLPTQDIGTPSDRGSMPVDAELFIDYAKDAFKQCIPENTKETWKELGLDFRLQKLFNEADKSIGNVFMFFLEKLHCSLLGNAPGSLCQGYLNVVKSLITLIRLIDQRRNKDIQLNDTIVNETTDSMEDNREVLEDTKEDKGEVFGSSREANAKKLLINQCYLREGVVSSTLAMTRTYQRRWLRITSKKDALTRQKLSKCTTESNGLSPLKPENLKGRKLKVQDIANDGNPFIEEMLMREGKVEGESFDDLSDFIVCKTGRDYSSWMKSHCRKRKKMLQKTYWKRLKAKKALVSLLASKKSQHVKF